MEGLWELQKLIEAVDSSAKEFVVLARHSDLMYFSEILLRASQDLNNVIFELERDVLSYKKPPN